MLLRWTNYTQLLQQLMQQVDIASFRQLSRTAGISERQLRRLRQGASFANAGRNLAQTLQSTASTGEASC